MRLSNEVANDIRRLKILPCKKCSDNENKLYRRQYRGKLPDNIYMNTISSGFFELPVDLDTMELPSVLDIRRTSFLQTIKNVCCLSLVIIVAALILFFYLQYFR